MMDTRRSAVPLLLGPWTIAGMLAGVFGFFGCGDAGGGSTCPVGTYFCPCAQGVCQVGLVCDAGFCLSPSEGETFGDDTSTAEMGDGDGDAGDGDGDAGDGDGDAGDGDGDPGDGDGDPGDGDGDPGDGDGDAGDGDGDTGSVCDPEPGELPCITCFKQSCCTEWEACVADGACGCYLYCYYENPDMVSECMDSCNLDNGDALIALSTCTLEPCMECF